jgi:hypothetical protein
MAVGGHRSLNSSNRCLRPVLIFFALEARLSESLIGAEVCCNRGSQKSSTPNALPMAGRKLSSNGTVWEALLKFE